MGFKFPEGIDNTRLDNKTDEVFAESDSFLTKLEQLLDKFKRGKSEDSSNITDDYKTKSEYSPTGFDGSVGEGSFIDFLTVNEEHNSAVSNVDNKNNKENIDDSLDKSTENERQTIKFAKNGIRYEIVSEPISESELEYFSETDPGYVSGNVLDYDNKDYISDGIHTVAWEIDSVEGTKEAVVFKAEDSCILCQWSHPGKTGSYFSDPETKYENLQLQDVQEKREQKFYEVIKDLPMEKSVINNQHFLDDASFEKTYQYVPVLKNLQERPMTAKELVEAGYLKETLNPENNKK